MSRGGRAVVVSTVFTVLAFCFVLVRCIGRFGIVKYVGRDDILIIAALVMSIGLTVCIALGKSWIQQCLVENQRLTECQKRTVASEDT